MKKTEKKAQVKAKSASSPKTHATPSKKRGAVSMAPSKGSAKPPATQKKGGKLVSLVKSLVGAATTSKKIAKPAPAPAKPAAKHASAGKHTAAKSDPKHSAAKHAPAKPAAAPAAAKGKVAAAPAAPIPGPALRKGPPGGKKGRVAKAPAPQISGAARLAAEAAGESICREVACESLASTVGYCRMHYIKNWKKIKRKELILKEKKLNQYIEELVAKYPDKYIEAIRGDLSDDRAFAKVIYDLELDESVDEFGEDAENADSMIENIKRDFEDEGEGF